MVVHDGSFFTPSCLGTANRTAKPTRELLGFLRDILS